MFSTKKYCVVFATIVAVAMVAFGTPQGQFAEPYNLSVTFEPCSEVRGINFLKIGAPITLTVNFLSPDDERPAAAMLHIVIAEAWMTDAGVQVGTPKLLLSQKVSTYEPFVKTVFAPDGLGARGFLVQVYADYRDGSIDWAPLEACFFLPR